MLNTVFTSVANIYKDPTYKCEIGSQALLGENVEVLSSENSFKLIRQHDKYEGWISEHQICEVNESKFDKYNVVSHIVNIFEKPEYSSLTIRDAVIGCKLRIMDSYENWYQIMLPDDITGWCQKSHFGEFPNFNRENIVSLAKRFLGIPYFWGGRTPKGFDCSGLIQTVFGLLGKQLRRDAVMQHEDIKKISDNPFDAQKGDLYFFGDDKINVDHVGIALGNGKIIHSRGMVKINSFDKKHPDFSQQLKDTLMAVSSVF